MRPQPPAQTPSQASLLHHLLGELDALRRSGALAHYFAPRPEELAELLLRMATETGDAERALDLLLVVDGPLAQLDSRYRIHVAKALLAQGSPRAGEAYQLALAHDPLDADGLAGLLAIDPAAMLKSIEASLQTAECDEETSSALQVERIRALFAVGRAPEAIAEITSRFGDGDVPEGLLAGMLERAPKAAIALLRSQLANSSDADRSYGLRRQLAAALTATGDTRGARAELETLLAEYPDNDELLVALGRIDGDIAESRWRARLASTPGFANEMRLANCLRAIGRTDSANAVLWTMFARSPADRSLQQALLANDSVAMAERMLTHARGLPQPPDDFDFLLGSVADVFWRHGETSRAIALWREAQQLDSAWSGRLTQALAGGDPLAARRRDWWSNRSTDF